MVGAPAPSELAARAQARGALCRAERRCHAHGAPAARAFEPRRAGGCGGAARGDRRRRHPPPLGAAPRFGAGRSRGRVPRGRRPPAPRRRRLDVGLLGARPPADLLARPLRDASGASRRARRARAHLRRAARLRRRSRLSHLGLAAHRPLAPRRLGDGLDGADAHRAGAASGARDATRGSRAARERAPLPRSGRPRPRGGLPNRRRGAVDVPQPRLVRAHRLLGGREHRRAVCGVRAPRRSATQRGALRAPHAARGRELRARAPLRDSGRRGALGAGARAAHPRRGRPGGRRHRAAERRDRAQALPARRARRAAGDPRPGGGELGG